MPMRIGTLMPELNNATEWLTSNAEEVAAIAQGHPTLVHFWAVSCGICKENMPKVHEWRDQLQDAGLRVIAIHMPRYEADTNLEAVRKAITDYDISEPCAVDNLHKLRDAFQNEQRIFSNGSSDLLVKVVPAAYFRTLTRSFVRR